MITCRPSAGGIAKSCVSSGVKPRLRTSCAASVARESVVAPGGGVVCGVVAGGAGIVAGVVDGAEAGSSCAAVVDEVALVACEDDARVVDGFEVATDGMAFDEGWELQAHITSAAAQAHATR
jgi:hypothetical protein